MISVKSEDQRIPATIKYVTQAIEELDREIKGCDYEEEPDGNMVYSPDCYSYEKRMLEAEKRKMEIIQSLLTSQIPFSAMDW